MKKFGVLCLLAMVFPMLFFASCDVLQKNKLSREKAKEIIIRDCFGGKINLPAIGLLVIGERTILFDDDSVIVKKLAKQGLLTMQVSPPPSQGHPFYNIFLSDSAKPFVLKKEEGMDMFSKRITAIIKLGNLTFNDITGIRLTQENKVAFVDFNYKYTDLTPFGDNWYEGPAIGSLMKNSKLAILKLLLLIKNNEVEINFDYKKRAPDLQQAIVKMELFDDGWKVAKRKNSE